MIRNDGRWQMSPRLERATALCSYSKFTLLPVKEWQPAARIPSPQEVQLRRRQFIDGAHLEGVIP
jgi:hypothetical protein